MLANPCFVCMCSLFRGGCTETVNVGCIENRKGGFFVFCIFLKACLFHYNTMIIKPIYDYHPH